MDVNVIGLVSQKPETGVAIFPGGSWQCGLPFHKRRHLYR